MTFNGCTNGAVLSVADEDLDTCKTRAHVPYVQYSRVWLREINEVNPASLPGAERWTRRIQWVHVGMGGRYSE